MKIVRAIELTKEFESYLENLIKECEYDSYSYEHILEKKNYEKYLLLINKKGNIKDIIYFIYNDKIQRNIYSPFFCEKGCFKAIKEFDANALLELEYFSDDDNILIPCNMRSSIIWENTYDIGHGSYYTVNSNDINIVRNIVEDSLFPKMDTQNISFEILDSKTFQDIFLDKETYSFNVWRNRSNHCNIIGFHYLQPNDLWENTRLLVARKNGITLGVIKFGIYDKDSKYEHYGLNYIDVNAGYRNMGIAKMLIKELSNHLEGTRPLVLTRESDMGEICKMEAHFKERESIYKCNIYTYKEWEKKWIG